MECCRCEKEIDLEKEDTYEFDYMGDFWCKPCMEDEVNHALKVTNGEVIV